MRRGAATILLFAAALVLAAALAVVLTGGFSVRAISLTIRDPIRPFVAGLVLLVAARMAGGAAFMSIVSSRLGPPVRLPARLAVLASVCVCVWSIAWGSHVAGGSDSSCYVLQAEAFARGRAVLENPVAAVLPGMPNGVFAPAGFLPSRSAYGQAVPICGPGLALLMAGAYLVRPGAVFLVVPACAALLVWSTFVLGRRLDGDLTGICAAVLLACSPIFLYQAVQPMSDVPAAAAWMAALVSASPIGAGLCASMAILIRPNLALLVLPLVLLKKGTAPFITKKRGLSPFFVAVVPGVVGLLVLSLARYGSVFASGYGDPGVLFSLAHVGPNLTRYPRWILDTQTPVLLLALAAPWILRRDAERASLMWVSLASTALLAATYLAYTVFDDWWYIRFLLPALPVALVLSVITLRRLFQSLPAPGRTPGLVAATVALSLWYGHIAETRHVFELHVLESRFAAVGTYAARSLPMNAVVLAGQHSGSVRFHGHRDTLAWDAIPPDALDRVARQFTAAGRPVVLVIEDAEAPAFRARFAGQRLGALDWPPMAEIPGPGRPRFYDVAVLVDASRPRE